ncbi:MAG: RidA family protein, partial [Gammaproteobacteria bacterium]|nr:RidA family protein [Gammaproteobacteria bacterium]
MTTRQQIFSASPYESQFGFCRATKIGNIIFVAGTAPIGTDGRTVGVGDPAAQARRCFDIIGESLEALGASYADVTRTRMFLTRITDWSVIGSVHGEYFHQINPVSTMVEVSRLIDPDWLV